MDVGYKEIHKQVTPTHGCAVQGNSHAGDSHRAVLRVVSVLWL